MRQHFGLRLDDVWKARLDELRNILVNLLPRAFEQRCVSRVVD